MNAKILEDEIYGECICILQEQMILLSRRGMMISVFDHLCLRRMSNGPYFTKYETALIACLPYYPFQHKVFTCGCRLMYKDA